MSTTNPVAGNQYFTRVTNSTSKFLDLNASNISGTNVAIGGKFKESFETIALVGSTPQALSLSTPITILDTSGASNAATLAAGEVGQLKTIALNPQTTTYATDVVKITLTGNPALFDVVTITATTAGTPQFINLLYTGATYGWVTVGGSVTAVVAAS